MLKMFFTSFTYTKSLTSTCNLKSPLLPNLTPFCGELLNIFYEHFSFCVLRTQEILDAKVTNAKFGPAPCPQLGRASRILSNDSPHMAN